MTAVFELRWPAGSEGRPAEHLEIGLGDDGRWWVDALYSGSWPVDGGAPHLAAFARWLLEPPPPGRFSKEFTVIDEQEPHPDLRRLMPHTIEVELLRADGDEYLVVYADDLPELRWKPLDRPRLEKAARALLAACHRAAA